MFKKTLCAVAFAAAFAAHAQETLKIAMIDPLSGPMADVGKIFENHLPFAADQINAKGGIDGIKLEVLAYDNKLSTQESEFRQRNFGGAFTTGYVLLFTDGGDTAGWVGQQQALDAIKTSPDQVIAVGLNGGDYDPSALQALAPNALLTASDPPALTSRLQPGAHRRRNRGRKR